MTRHIRTLLAAAAAGAAVAAASPSALAGLTIVSQERSVDVSLVDATSGTGGSTTQIDRDAATGTGPFAGNARVQRTGAGVNNRVGATMQSNLGGSGDDGRWTFGGILDIDLDDEREDFSPSANARFTARVEFSIDAPYAYALSGGVDLSGSNQGGGQLFELIEGVSPDAPSPTEWTGTLPAGTYRLSLAQEIDSAERDADFRSDYDYTFTLTAANGGGGGGNPAPVPLPPAVWAGLITMGGMAAAQNRLRRRAALGN